MPSRSCARVVAAAHVPTPIASRIPSLLALLVLAGVSGPVPTHARVLGACPGDATINLPVSTPAGDQLHANAVPDGSGGAIVTWYDSRSGTNDVYAHHVLSTGAVDPAWPANGVMLVSDAGGLLESPPVIATDGSGGAIVAWTPLTGGTLYVQRVLGSGMPDPAWPAGGRVVSVFGEYPRLISDGSGGAIVAWDDGADVYAQHVLDTGALDPSWLGAGVVVCNSTGGQGFAQICSDGAGGALVAWNDSRTPSRDIYAHHVLATGVIDPVWPGNGRAVCTLAGSQRFDGARNFPSFPINSCADHQGNGLIPDGAGGCLMAWTDGRGAAGPTSYDIYVHHVLSDGSVDPTWTADGNALCLAVGDQGPCRLVPDGAGGAIAFWTDLRSGSDVYVQHVLSTGAMDGPTDGLALVTDTGVDPAAVPDGSGGMIISWEDQRDAADSTNLYVQHVVTSPSLAVDATWTAGGVAISTAFDHQILPSLASDGIGGAIIAWSDYRDRDTQAWDTYADRVSAAGCLTWPSMSLDVTVIGEGSVAKSPDRARYDDASSVTLTATPDAGWVFDGWSGDASGNDNPLDVTMTGDLSITATFTEITGVESRVVTRLDLAPVRPNPARGDVAFRFALPSPSRVRLGVIDVQGREVTVVADGEYPAGRHEARLTRGVGHEALEPGLYFLRLRALGKTIVRRFSVTQ